MRLASMNALTAVLMTVGVPVPLHCFASFVSCSFSFFLFVPDICAVIPKFVEMLLNQKWVQSYYVSDGESARSVTSFGCLLLSKLPFNNVCASSLDLLFITSWTECVLHPCHIMFVLAKLMFVILRVRFSSICFAASTAAAAEPP
jgi:hypothetical protein